MEEQWMPIKGFEGLYSISNFGMVKSLSRIIKNNGNNYRKREHILSQNTSSNMHCSVALCKNGKTYSKLVHRLVAEAFIPNPHNKQIVDHIDTDPKNNKVDNLRWVTVQENCLNPLTRIHNSESKKGHPYYGRPLTKDEKEKIRIACIGRVFSEEHKKKISEAHKNSGIALKASRENLAKAHNANRGKHRSEETKEKISRSRKENNNV